jgi:CrcB protein
VNLVGSCAIGFVLTLAFERGLVAPATRLFLVTGVLGGFTTFSAFSWETLVLVRDGQALPALGYVAGSVLGGFAAALLGASLAARFGLTVASLAG